MTEPTWARVSYPKIDYQDLYYYSAPKKKGDGPEVARRDRPGDPEDLRETRHSAAKEQEMLAGVEAARGSRSMRCSTRFRSQRPSRKN